MKQRNMFQIKEENKIPEKELNGMKITNLTDKEFKIIIIRILKYGWTQNFNIERQFKKEPIRTEEYNNWNEKNNTLEEIKSRLDGTGEWISDMEDGIVVITQSEQ